MQNSTVAISWFTGGMGTFPLVAAFISIVLSGCATTLPSSGASPTVVGCHDVRSGFIRWEIARDLNENESKARKAAIHDSLAQLQAQLTGIEFRTMSRTSELTENDRYSSDVQFSDNIRQHGRVLNYEIISMTRTLLPHSQYFNIHLKGTVCADQLQPTLLVAAVRADGDISPETRKLLEAVLSRRFSKSRYLTLADRAAEEVYQDVRITPDISKPIIVEVDRQSEIAAVQANLGRWSTAGASTHAISVTVHATLRADILSEGSTIVESKSIERLIPDRRSVSTKIIMEMENAGLEQAASDLARSLENHFMRVHQ